MTRLLLDTHFVIYLAGDIRAIRPAEVGVLAAASGPWLVSAVSIWEIRLKWNALNRLGRRKGPISPQLVIKTLNAERAQFEFIALPADQPALPALDPPLAHGDPFDEMLLLQAKTEGARLLTRDQKLRDHPLALCAD